jgi:general nucleoside transport system permease protein
MADAADTTTLDRLAKRFGPNVIAPVLAGVIAIVVSALTLYAGGYNAIDAFAEIAKVLWRFDSVILITNRAAWYYVAGVAVAIGFKMGLFNIGVDGQYRLAALFAAYLGAQMSLPKVIHIPIVIAIAVTVGAAWAAIPGLLKVTRGVNEVISTIMLNYVATGLTAWLLGNYFRFETGQLLSATKSMPTSARIPHLDRLVEAIGLDVPDAVQLQGYLIIAILVGIGYYVLLFRSRFGFDLRATGLNPAAARSSGINPKRMVLVTIILSGAVAGLIGMGALLSDPQHYKYSDQFPLSLGFTGLSLALLGRNHPVGIAFAGIVWAAIERGTQPLTQKGFPQEIGRIMQGAFLLTAVIVFEVMQRRAAREQIREAATRAHMTAEGAPA